MKQCSDAFLLKCFQFSMVNSLFGFKNVDYIDLFPAGISKRSVDGSIVGPTFVCIITRQFESLPKSDRFLYKNEDAFSFTEGLQW